MLIKISDSAIQLLLNEVLPTLKITKKINIEEIERIFKYLEDKEVFLASDIEDGEIVDKNYLDCICRTLDEFNVEDETLLDFDDLNIRLGFI